MPGRLHGILVIDKPAGWTSHDVVGWVRRWAGERKVGHAGTLDPAATGVLPIALNDGTRVLEFLSEASKAYLAEITFGVATDSADGDGTVVAISSDRPTFETIERHLPAFLGEIQQVPPAHSAIRIGGKRAYELARAGEEVDMPVRTVTINAIDPCAWNGDTLRVHIECSKGTYIRSIARDLGVSLGIPSYLSGLVRTRSGPYGLDDAWTTTELSDLPAAALWEEIAIHPDSALGDFPALVLDEQAQVDWAFGRSVVAHSGQHSGHARVYDSHGQWLGIARSTEGQTWRPVRVISPS